VLSLFIAPAGSETKPDIYSARCWLLPGSPGKITWVEIMNIEDARKTGIAHVWVLARKKGAPKWEVEHVCYHIAITTDALRRSVTQPYKSAGAYYPDVYRENLEMWKRSEKEGKASICTTSISDYLRQPK